MGKIRKCHTKSIFIAIIYFDNTNVRPSAYSNDTTTTENKNPRKWEMREKDKEIQNRTTNNVRPDM